MVQTLFGFGLSELGDAAYQFDLTDAVAERLNQPFSIISIETVYRSLYFFTNARHRGETHDVVAYLANEAKFFGIIKRKHKDDNPSPLVFVQGFLKVRVMSL